MNLTIQKDLRGEPLRKPWKNAIAVGRAYELLREDVLEHLRHVQSAIGYRYCRFHGIFHDEMAVVGTRSDGSLAFRWHQVDKVYDALLEMGLRPFVELNPMPAALASGVDTIFDWKMNVTPPKDYGEWECLVEAFCRHLVDRYGLDEVKEWYFEVWNEPNLSGFWTGTQEEYWRLYEASARAVKRTSSELRIGGPATSKANWIADIIQHCTKNDVPLDFVSTHVYPQDEYVTYCDRDGSPHRPGKFFEDTFRSVQQVVKQSSRPELEIHWTEWNSLSTPSTSAITWTNNTAVDSIFGAGMVIGNCVALDSVCDTMCWWVASDVFEECGMPHSEFSCTYGLLTLNGLPKATFHAFDFLNRLRGPRLQTSSDEALAPGCGWVVTQETITLQILLWHQIIPEVQQSTWEGCLVLPVSVSDKHTLIQAKIAPGCGSAWETWKDLGSPQNLSRSEMRLLSAHAQPEYRMTTYDGGGETAEWHFRIEPGEVYFLEFQPKSPEALPKTFLRSELASWEKKMSDASKVS
jgi:xylan 1,4-beta-xylosidase